LHSRRQSAGERGGEIGVQSDHQAAIGKRREGFAIGQVVDQPNRWRGHHGRHLCTQEFARHLHGREIYLHTTLIRVKAHPVDAIGGNLFRQRVVSVPVGARPGIGVVLFFVFALADPVEASSNGSESQSRIAPKLAGP
jgi:hypothetical protein